MRNVRTCLAGFLLVPFCWKADLSVLASAPVSEETEACLVCHNLVSPGIVADWKKSLHATVTPGQALQKDPLERRISVTEAPQGLDGFVVGCAECHGVNPEKHKDTFDHGGYKIHVIVTPGDCAACHAVEAEQYTHNIMSHAYANLADNPLYHALADSVNGIHAFEDMKIALESPDPQTNSDSCFHCHGTSIKLEGSTTRKTIFGKMEFPVLSGWPNQGVGRVNPDETLGSCTSCHTRHRFSIEMARKPFTCSQCHKGPDVPADKVYAVSKHGNIFSSLGDKWNFNAVPWVVGNDFTAPTCATCHVSLVVKQSGERVAERTHRMNDRLPWRIFGLIYAHPHPKSPDTTIIKNKAGLPLPTELTGEPVVEFLIDSTEQERRSEVMQGVCLACHGPSWVEGHFSRFENTIKTTNEMTLTATKILMAAWDKGAADGLRSTPVSSGSSAAPGKADGQSHSIFDEPIEKKWVEQWLFFANSTRFASAMAGADYGVFANGRWYLSKNIREMAEWLECKLKTLKEHRKE